MPDKQHTETPEEKQRRIRRRNKFYHLHEDAPEVPQGKQPRRGVEFGCGRSDCTDCYEPEQDRS